MYQPSEKFLQELNKKNRTFRARITSGSDTLKEEIRSVIVTMGSCGSDTFAIGSVFSSYADIVLSSNNVQLSDKEIGIEFGILFPDGELEYVPMGLYTVKPSDISKTRDLITVKAGDRIASKCTDLYIPSIEAPYTIQDVIDDMERQAVITIETDLDTSGIIEKDMIGLTYRQTLGYISCMLGGFCYADRNGVIRIASYPSSASAEVQEERFWEIQFAEKSYKVESLTVVVSDAGVDEQGNQTEGVSYTYGSGNGIAVSNPYMTQSIFDSMKNRVAGYEFYPGNAVMLGNPCLGPEDAIKAFDYSGSGYLLPCMSIIHDYDGGLTTTITTPGLAVSDESTKGPLMMQVERIGAGLLVAQEKIKLKVERVDINNAINDLQIGGKNLIRNSKTMIFSDYYFQDGETMLTDEDGNILTDESGNILIF